MLTYLTRKRRLVLEGGEEPCWPADCEVRFLLRPRQAFGMAADGGRTAVRGVGTIMRFDAVSGRHHIQSALSEVIACIVDEHDVSVRLAESMLVVRRRFADTRELGDLINTVSFVYPWLLNVSLADAPSVERVEGHIGGVSFTWQLAGWTMPFETTTQAEQEVAVSRAWMELGLFANAGRRRLLAALHYFYVARRLIAVGESPGEFLAEVVLNYSKALESLFPAPPNRTREAAREGLRALGYQDETIEARFIPAHALRSGMGVAHPQMSVFSLKQLTVVHEYTEAAELWFKELFRRVLKAVEAGEWDVPEYDPAETSSDAATTISKLEAALAAQVAGGGVFGPP